MSHTMLRQPPSISASAELARVIWRFRYGGSKQAWVRDGLEAHPDRRDRQLVRHRGSPHRASDIADQRERADHYVTTISTYASPSWLLGWHWCGYLENPTRGVGMKDPYDEPYHDFVEPVSTFNREMARRMGQRVPVDL